MAHRERSKKSGFGSLLSYWCITFIHGNPLINMFRNPKRKLEEAGVKSGQKILEVGCGPGFYTIPAAGIAGAEGQVYAMDLQAGFIKKVETKASEAGLQNVIAIIGDASQTSFDDGSMDLILMFGLGHIAGGLEGLAAEMARVIRPDGRLAYERGSGRTAVLKVMESAGFSLDESKGRLMIFKKDG